MCDASFPTAFNFLLCYLYRHLHVEFTVFSCHVLNYVSSMSMQNTFLKVLGLAGSIVIVKVSLAQGQCQNAHAYPLHNIDNL